MQTIHLDISNKGVYSCIYAKQGDVGRKFCLIVTNNGVPYECEEALVSVWYKGDSGEGNYTDIGESSAIEIRGNKITVSMIQQMLTNPGGGVLSLSITDDDGNQIGLWNIDYCVEEKPGANSEEAKQYYDAFSKSTEQLLQAANLIASSQERIDMIIQSRNKSTAGLIYPLATENVPNGFLPCDGRECSRTEYSELFEAIGTIYGEGDGSTTFNVPDLQTRVPVGVGDGYDLGDDGGEEKHTLSVEELPSYSISIPGRLNSTSGGSGAFEYSGNWQAETTYNIESGGSGQAHNIMQPYTVVNYIISTGKEIEYVVAGGGVVSNFVSVDGQTFRQTFEEHDLIAGTLYLITSDEWLEGPNKGDIVLATGDSSYAFQVNIIGEKGEKGDPGTGGGGSSVVFGYGVPNDETEGELGTFYFDEYERELYMCIDIWAEGEKVWHKISVDEDEIVQKVLAALPSAEEVGF